MPLAIREMQITAMMRYHSIPAGKAKMKNSDNSESWWHEFEQTLGVGDEQGGLACCSPWGRKESDMTE